MAASLTGRTFTLSPYDRGSGPVSTINALFESAAQEFCDRVIGVILTGLLKDGTTGLQAIHDGGGITIVQDPQDAVSEHACERDARFTGHILSKVSRHWCNP